MYSPAIDIDPFPGCALLRENIDCCWNESAQLWILSRYEIVEAALHRR